MLGAHVSGKLDVSRVRRGEDRSVLYEDLITEKHGEDVEKDRLDRFAKMMVSGNTRDGLGKCLEALKTVEKPWASIAEEEKEDGGKEDEGERLMRLYKEMYPEKVSDG